MHHLISVLLCLMASCVASKAWYNRHDNAVYGGWAPDRRSMMGCSETGGRCFKNYQCCSNNDYCLLEKNGFGLCKARNNVLDAYLPNSKFGFKKTGQECVDSLECADQCCRPKRVGRIGVKLMCGKPDENTACVGRVFSVNDIYNGY